jgi:hypothetical protein
MEGLFRCVLKDILSTYGSLILPDWGFMRIKHWTLIHNEQNVFYQEVLDELNNNSSISLFFTIRDRSDYMYELGPALQMSHADRYWWLYISLVGRYALFLRQIGELTFDVISCTNECNIPEEREVLSILQKHSIAPLSKILVDIQIPEFKLWEYQCPDDPPPTIRDVLFYYV